MSTKPTTHRLTYSPVVTVNYDRRLNIVGVDFDWSDSLDCDDDDYFDLESNGPFDKDTNIEIADAHLSLFVSRHGPWRWTFDPAKSGPVRVISTASAEPNQVMLDDEDLL